MDQKTNKAASLPSDLAGYWEELMEEKFPLTMAEAKQYLIDNYRIYAFEQGHTLIFDHTIFGKVRRGEQIPQGAEVRSIIPIDRYDYNPTLEWRLVKRITIDKFTKNEIDRKIREMSDAHTS